MDVLVHKLDEVYLFIECNKDIAAQLNDYFTFEEPGSQFKTNFRPGWDGYTRLFSKRTHKIGIGLLWYVLKFCTEYNYSFAIDPELKKVGVLDNVELDNYISELDLVDGKCRPIEPYWYQRKILDYTEVHNRGTFTAATSAGKSLAIYLMTRRALHKNPNNKVLILCPGVGLVHQMVNDFKDYSQKNGWDVDAHTHVIYSGQDKASNKSVIVSTWQSIYKLPKEDFKDYTHLICDEVHGAEGASIQAISKKMVNASHRYGLTGTLKDAKAHTLTIQSAFGKVVPIVKTWQLQEGGQAAQLFIKQIGFRYKDSPGQMDFMDEKDWLSKCDVRNNTLAAFANSLKGNTLLFFERRVQGDAMYEYLKEHSNKDVFIINGDVKGDVRNDIKHYMNKYDDCIVVASYGTTSTGWSVNNIHNIIFGAPSKSIIRVLQSVGRGLRLNDNKEYCTLYDIFDIFEGFDSFSFKHAIERTKIYRQERFNIKQKVFTI